MSRIGNLPIEIPGGVNISLNQGQITVKGPKGSLGREIHPGITVKQVEQRLVVGRPDDTRKNKALHGLTRALINNMVTGVTSGFERKLQIEGVGYRAVMKGKGIVFSLGYSHTIEVKPVDGIEYEIGQKGEMVVKGIDKELVGQVAANIRQLRKPDPYKGKGIRYSDEIIIKKVGKAGAK
ncbi:MAG: 50S ribosomal protein L6 [Nitrospinota bacterium]